MPPVLRTTLKILWHAEAKDEHKAAFGSDPGAFFEGAYAATVAMLNAIEKAGSTNLEDLKKVLQTEKVATPVGKINFDQNGDAIGVGFSMYVVENGTVCRSQVTSLFQTF